MREERLDLRVASKTFLESEHNNEFEMLWSRMYCIASPIAIASAE